MQRLLKRNQDTTEQIKERFKGFDEDVKHWKDYDYIIINQSLENCLSKLKK